ncbi:family 4 glycosyl hydrolase, partial [Alicyclobacillus sendaiensis]|uniref:family 4 glycosyl hydrolase n=1 Tax=Alicyclobacillus sendaiensis TaxID=192387 RepID=UPI003F8B3CC7
MSKITFIGAGSTVIAKNVLGDCMLTPSIDGFEFALYDIEEERLRDSERMLLNLKHQLKANVKIKAYHDRRLALAGAKYVINAIQVGGYKPSTVIDFEVPKKYGLRQTSGDTVGIGGLFRALRTIPVMLSIARDMQELCPDAWFFNYTNPMAVLTNAMITYGGIKTVGLCHSVQVCVPQLFERVGMDATDVEYKIAGINHMA